VSCAVWLRSASSCRAPGGGGPPPIITGVLAPALHAGAGGVQARRATQSLHAPSRPDLGPRLWLPWINLDGLMSTTSSSLSYSSLTPSSYHSSMLHASARELIGVDAGRRETTPHCVLPGPSRALRARLWESLEAATMLTEVVFSDARHHRLTSSLEANAGGTTYFVTLFYYCKSRGLIS
jgi:hypothetical protein